MDPLSYPSNIHIRPHLWQISGGSGPPVPPPTLDPRMHFFVCIGKWKDNGPPFIQSCEALQLNITRSVIFKLYIFSESTSIHDIASAGFESTTLWLQVTYMLDIQRNWQSKLSNVPLSINVFWVNIILIILFKKNFTTKNGIWLNLSAIYLHCTLCEESCTGVTCRRVTHPSADRARRCLTSERSRASQPHR